ncbi:MAG: hypothetical protein B6D36_09255 [Planctomycetes bacterium UTPLA1]|nr:MAG: hypothetical protein B6D36_09255 [Planctomycetes bacterium UTPLA1]
MGIKAPEWLWLLAIVPLLVPLAWAKAAPIHGSWRLWSVVIRAGVAMLIILALAQPFSDLERKPKQRSKVILLEDVSESVMEDHDHTTGVLREFEQAIKKNTDVEHRRFAAILDPLISEGTRELRATDLAQALDTLSTSPEVSIAPTVVVFSDGRETRGDAIRAAATLCNLGGSVHVVPVGRKRSSAPEIITLSPPDRAKIGETSQLRVGLRVQNPTMLSLVLYDEDGIALAREDITAHSDTTVVLRIRSDREGIRHGRVVLEDDSRRTQLDSIQFAYQVDGPPRALICDSRPLEVATLKGVLEALGYTIDVCLPDAFSRLQDILPQYDFVILSDLESPNELGNVEEPLGRYVEEGGTLVFLGGSRVSTRQWHNTGLELLLPVRFTPEARLVEVEVAPTNVCLVLDVSGSMAEPLGTDAAGNPVVKLEMTKQAVRETLKELSPTTRVSIVAFTGGCATIVSGVPAGEPARIESRLDALIALGGTNMVPALEDAVDILKRSEAARHLILMTDGVSEAYPDEALQQRIISADISATIVSVGPDSDRASLQYFCDRVRGQFYFCPDANTIPQVFVKEAKTIRSLRGKTRIPVIPIAGPDGQYLAPLARNGFPKLEAAIPSVVHSDISTETAMVTDQGQPLLVIGRRGFGAVVAFLSDMKTVWGLSWLEWPKLSAFWAALIQRVVHPKTELQFRFELDEHHESLRVLASVRNAVGELVPKINAEGVLTLIDGSPETVGHLQWRRLPSGVFEGRASSWPDARALCAVKLRDEAGQVIASSNFIVPAKCRLETAQLGPDLPKLKLIAGAGKGLFNPSPDQLAAIVTKQVTVTRPIKKPHWPYCILLALLLWPFDVAVRRLGH